MRNLSFREGKDVQPNVIVALEMQRPGRYRYTPLLPNLVTLKWTVSSSSTLTLCIPLVSSSLRVLAVHVVGAEAIATERNDATGGLLCTVADIAPEITEISLNIDKLWTVGDVANPLITLTHLRVLKLEVGSIGPFILRGLCQHKSLSRLEIDLCGMDESFLGHLSENRPRADEFPALKELSITADMHVVNTTFSMLIRAPLTSVAISTFTLIHPSALFTLLSTLSETSPHLRELRIDTSFSEGSTTLFEGSIRRDEAEVGLVHLMPLMSMKHLEILSLHIFYPVKVDDVDVAMMVGALPALTDFTMNPAPEWTPPGWKPSATLHSLRWLATNAVKLRSLGLAVDYGASPATDMGPFNEVVEQFHSRSKPVTPMLTPPLTPESSFMTEGSTSGELVSSLETLCLGASHIPDGMEDRVAECLVTLFPRLQVLRPSDMVCELDCSHQSGESMKERWDRVLHGVQMRRIGAVAGIPTTTGKKRTQLVFDMMDADVEMDVCKDYYGNAEDDEYEWALASANVLDDDEY